MPGDNTKDLEGLAAPELASYPTQPLNGDREYASNDGEDKTKSYSLLEQQTGDDLVLAKKVTRGKYRNRRKIAKLDR